MQVTIVLLVLVSLLGVISSVGTFLPRQLMVAGMMGERFGQSPIRSRPLDSVKEACRAFEITT